MPKKPIDYSKCCIYKIQHIDKEDLVYVGHTTNFTKRKCQHKYICKSENDSKYNLKIYQMIRENGGFDMFRMIEIEKYPCNDKREAEKRECEVMKKLKASLNTMNSYVSNEEKKESRKEYEKRNKEKNQGRLKDYNNNYYQNNKSRIKENVKIYSEINKGKIIEYQKEYIEKKKEKLNEYQTKYYEEHQEKIKKQQKLNRDLNKENKKEYDRKYREKQKLKEHNQ